MCFCFSFGKNKKSEDEMEKSGRHGSSHKRRKDGVNASGSADSSSHHHEGANNASSTDAAGLAVLAVSAAHASDMVGSGCGSSHGGGDGG